MLTVPDAPRILVGPSVIRSDEARQREVEILPPARTPKSHLERAKPPDTVEALLHAVWPSRKRLEENRRCNEKRVDGKAERSVGLQGSPQGNKAGGERGRDRAERRGRHHQVAGSLKTR